METYISVVRSTTVESTSSSVRGWLRQSDPSNGFQALYYKTKPGLTGRTPTVPQQQPAFSEAKQFWSTKLVCFEVPPCPMSAAASQPLRDCPDKPFDKIPV